MTASIDDLRDRLLQVVREAGDGDDPAPAVRVLADGGALTRFIETRPDGGYRYHAGWRDVLDLLVALGGADLSTARLFEGHLNALQLVSLFGTREQQRRVLAAASAGGMLGVWGADAEPPVRREDLGEGRWRLSGAKRYASGAGTLRHVLVPVTETGGAMELLLLDVSDAERVDPSSWDMRGMRRSASGTYRFDDIVVERNDHVGAADDYRREPYFVGGIWRCAAAQLGAIEAIVRTLAMELSRSGRDAHPLQLARIGTAIIEARTARLWIEDAAARVETFDAASPDALEKVVALAAYARLVTERTAMAVIDLAERALGLGSFAHGHPVEASTRDLAVYIRQANPDAVLLQHGRVLAKDLVR